MKKFTPIFTPKQLPLAHIWLSAFYENGISIEQVLNVILTGTVRKKEADERSGGKFTKYTIRKGRITVTVKDCYPAFIITANRR